MKKRFLSLAAVKRLFRKSKGNIGLEGYLEFEKALENYAKIVAKFAIKNAIYEARKSVKSKDIKEALKEIGERKEV